MGEPDSLLIAAVCPYALMTAVAVLLPPDCYGHQ